MPSEVLVHCSGRNLARPWLVPIDMARVHAGLADEVLNFAGLGVMRMLCRYVILDTGQYAEFTLDGDVILL